MTQVTCHHLQSKNFRRFIALILFYRIGSFIIYFSLIRRKEIRKKVFEQSLITWSLYNERARFSLVRHLQTRLWFRTYMFCVYTENLSHPNDERFYVFILKFCLFLFKSTNYSLNRLSESSSFSEHFIFKTFLISKIIRPINQLLKNLLIKLF